MGTSEKSRRTYYKLAYYIISMVSQTINNFFVLTDVFMGSFLDPLNLWV